MFVSTLFQRKSCDSVTPNPVLFIRRTRTQSSGSRPIDRHTSEIRAKLLSGVFLGFFASRLRTLVAFCTAGCPLMQHQSIITAKGLAIFPLDAADRPLSQGEALRSPRP